MMINAFSINSSYWIEKEDGTLTRFEVSDAAKEAARFIRKIDQEGLVNKDWDTAKNGYLYPLTWGAFNWFEYAYIPIKEYGFDFDEAYLNIKAMLPQDMANGNFADWTAKNAQYAFAGPLMNNFDDKLLGDQSKLNSIYLEGWFKSVLTTGDFDEEWTKMESRWLSAGGKEVIEYGNSIYKK